MKSLGTSTIDARVFEKKKKQPSPKKNLRPEKKRTVLERVKPKKNRALTTEKKGKIETEYSQIETVRLGFFFFLPATCGGGTMVEEQWRRR